jgi:hypothetical protein
MSGERKKEFFMHYTSKRNLRIISYNNRYVEAEIVRV